MIVSSRWKLGVALAFAIASLAPRAAAAPVTVQHNVEFSEYPALAREGELFRRLLTPLTYARLQNELAQSAQHSTGQQPLALADERFVVYVPQQAPPPTGYGLLVFVPPWDQDGVPVEWVPVLDRYGLIFVSAARSGNEQNVWARRIPLALIAEQNIVARYPVDPARIYVAGFSGGSRVALRIALGFPDIFRGALLDAGSDPIGTKVSPLPPKDLFLQFQSTSRLVLATGEEDSPTLDAERVSVRALRELCVFGAERLSIPRTGHQLADGRYFSKALDLLLHPDTPDPMQFAECRLAQEKEIARQLAEVEALLARGRHDDAQERLIDIDAHFGGLAAPKSLDLADK